MKKLLTFLSIATVAAVGHAAALDWQYNATSADVGKTVYVMLATADETGKPVVVDQWEDLNAVKGASLDSGAVAKKGVRYNAAGSFNNDKVTKSDANVYFVVVDADGSTFGVTSVSDMTGSVYDPTAQESSSGNNTSLSSSSITKSGIAWGTGGSDDPPGPGPDDPPGPGPDDPPTPGPGPGGDGDVPEPTSGILLMIGGAALALRRRR